MITLAVTKQFFDRQVVIDAVGRAEAGVLGKVGSFIRRTAKGSLKDRTSAKNRHESAPAGSPPFNHSRNKYASLKFILFAFDPTTRSMVIGPVALNQVNFNRNMVVKGAVPAIQEFGGMIGEHQFKGQDGTWRRTDFRSRRRAQGRPQRIRTARIRPHPFMGPAMEKELPKFPDLWKNAVVRGG